MDRLDSLAFFIRIIEKGGVAAAGRDFGLSPASASERLGALESHYEAKLLQRTTRSISLTEEGRLLVEKARHLVADAQDIKSQIKYGTEHLAGLIRISAPQDIGQRHVAPLLDSFMAMNPDINVDLHLSDSHIDLVSLGIDIAVRFGSLKDSSLMVKKLGDNARVICAAPSYLEIHGMPTHPDDLQQHNCLIMKFGPVIDREWMFKVKGKQRAYAISGNRITNNGAQVHQWCLDGQGIALKSIWDVGEDLEAGRLTALLEDYAPTSTSALQLVYPGGGKPNRRIRAIIDFLTIKLKE